MEYTIQGGQQIIIREARTEDAEKLLKTAKKIINEQGFALTSPEEFNYTIEQEKKFIQSHLENPREILFVADVSGEIIGMLDVRCCSRKKLAHTVEFGMSVLKEWRNKGIGGFLLRELIDWGDKNNIIEKITLQVFANNERAIYLYKKFGFKEEGRQVKAIKFDDGKYVDNVLMYRMSE